MKKAVVIGSYVGSPWLAECLDSMPKDVPLMVVCQPFYETGVIKWTHENTSLDEFLFLPDTVFAKRHEWIYEALAQEGRGVSVIGSEYSAFIGKYRRVVLDRMHTHRFIYARNKDEAIPEYSAQEYAKLEGSGLITLWPRNAEGLDDGPNREFKNGRDNMVIANGHLVKYKGCWQPEMSGGVESRDAKLAGRIITH